MPDEPKPNASATPEAVEPLVMTVPFPVPGASPLPSQTPSPLEALPSSGEDGEAAALAKSLVPPAPLALAARRGRHATKPPVTFEVVRDILPEDLPVLADPAAQPPGVVPRLTRLRHQHHLLAQLLANGATNVDAAYVTGYTPERVWQLRQDPVFQELLASYEGTKSLAFVDVMERMKNLGMSALEELQSRLDEKPEDFSSTKLLEVLETLLLKGRAGPGSAVPAGMPAGGGGGAPPAAIQINFVAPQGKTIPGTAEGA